MYYTYILWSKVTRRYYSGSTNNVIKRIGYHTATKRGYTATGQPWILVYVKTSNSRSKAMKLESIVKKRGAKRFLNDKLIIQQFD